MNNEYEEMIDFEIAKKRINRMRDSFMDLPKRDRIGAILEMLTVLVTVIGDTYKEEEDA